MSPKHASEQLDINQWTRIGNYLNFGVALHEGDKECMLDALREKQTVFDGVVCNRERLDAILQQLEQESQTGPPSPQNS